MVHVKASAAVSHVGKVRAQNQDSGYAGRNLFFVADGMGGHAGGDVASSLATDRMADADEQYEAADVAGAALQHALIAANRRITETVADHPELAGMGTTVSSITVLGDQVVVAHIGDSRVYLLRAGELRQITTDHSFVQRLVDAGRITEEEARVHPRRSVLMRVLGDVESSPTIDVMTLDTYAGDRWLVCSDGLSGYVEFDDLTTLLAESSTKIAADKLIKAALDEGAPDNVTVVLVDIGEPPAPDTPPVIVGAAAAPTRPGPVGAHRRSIRLTPFRPHPVQETHFEPDSDDYLDELIDEDRRRRRRRRAWLTFWIFLVAAAIAAAAIGFVKWTETRYYIGESNGRVAIYQGIQQDLGPIVLHHVYRETAIDVGDLRDFDQQRIERTISASSLEQAEIIVDRLMAGNDG